MTRISHLLTVTAGFFTLISAVSNFGTKSGIIHGRYIVEFEESGSLSKRSSTGDVSESLVQILSQEGLSAKPQHIYDAEDIFQGASVTVESDTDPKTTMKKLNAHPAIKNVWPVRVVELMSEPNAPIFKESVFSNDSRSDNGKSATIVNPPSNKQDPDAFPRWNPHLLTGVAELHKRGITGKGVTVGIIDTGTFYYDPALGGGFGAGYKVEGGWNFVGDLFNPIFEGSTNFTANGNPLDCTGHGSHVAGIVAGSNNPNFVGVAPDAKIRSYKIFGCHGSASNDIIIQAIIRAYSDGVDIISMSLGSSGDPFQGNPEGMILDRVVERGVFAAVAAGNSGATGPFYGSGPATGKYMTTVASATVGQTVSYRARAVSSTDEFLDFTFVAPSNVQPNITGTFAIKIFNESACTMASSIPKNTGNKNIALLFPQQSCTNRKFFSAIKSLGYPVALNYLDTPSNALSYMTPAMGLNEPVALRATTESAFGNWVSAQTKLNRTVDLILDQTSLVPRLFLNTGDLAGPRLSYFTSWGPDFSGNLYPHITAPGSSIYSTYRNFTYATISGTSMATPYISGVAALYLQSVGGRRNSRIFGRDIRSRMIQTSFPLYSSVDSGIRHHHAPLIQQGAGMINATRLVDSKSYIASDPIINLGIMSTVTPKTTTVDVHNDNDYPVIYNISHVPALTTYTKSTSDVIFNFFPPFIYKYAAVSSKSSTFTIPPHSSLKVNITVTIPNTVSSQYSPIYQGRVNLLGHNGDALALPYIGTFGSNFSIWGKRDPYIVAKNNSTGSVEIVKGLSTTISNDGNSFINYNSLFGARVIDMFLVERNFNLNNLSLPVRRLSDQRGIVTDFSGLPIYNAYRSPTASSIAFDLPEGVKVTDGVYRILLAGLPVSSGIEPVNSKTKDWEVYLSEPVSFKMSTPISTPLPPYANSSIPTYSNVSTLAITGATVSPYSTNSTVATSPFDWFQVEVNIASRTALVVGQSVNVTMPSQFDAVPKPFLLNNDFGTPILNITFSNGVLIATVINTMKDVFVTGTLAFVTSLKNPGQYGNEPIVLTFSTPEGKDYISTLDFAPYDTSFLSSNAYTYLDHSNIQLYIPSTFTNWTILDINLGTRFEFGCNHVRVAETKNLDAYNSAVYDYNYSSFQAGCTQQGSKSLDIRLTAPPAPGNGLRIDVPVNTKGDVIDTPVTVHFRGLVDGNEFNYYTANILNNYPFTEPGLSLSGKRV